DTALGAASGVFAEELLDEAHHAVAVDAALRAAAAAGLPRSNALGDARPGVVESLLDVVTKADGPGGVGAERLLDIPTARIESEDPVDDGLDELLEQPLA